MGVVDRELREPGMHDARGWARCPPSPRTVVRLASWWAGCVVRSHGGARNEMGRRNDDPPAAARKGLARRMSPLLVYRDRSPEYRPHQRITRSNLRGPRHY